jgi:hypothetical protein
MTVNAIFQMNTDVDIKHTLTFGLTHMLCALFQTGKMEQEATFRSIVAGEERLLSEIIGRAREVSYKIQHDVVSSRLMVTIAPAGDPEALGTCGFGLHRIAGLEHT